jgi:CIC family chloride channel protein
MLSATTRSPLLAMIMVFEISLDYSLMPPLMIACVVSFLVSRRLYPESIYTEPLRRKGVTVSQDATASEAATERTVSELMRLPVPPVRETSTYYASATALCDAEPKAARSSAGGAGE